MAKVKRGRDNPSAADVLRPLWWSQVSDLRMRESEVRVGQVGAVQHFRVAARRLQTSVSAFADLVDIEVTDRLDKNLEQTIAVFGDARDAEILQGRLDRLLARNLPDRGAEEVRGTATALLRGRYEDGWQRALLHLDDAPYDALVRRLDRFSDLPPWTPRSRRPAERVLRAPVREQWDRFRGRGRRALAQPPGSSQDVLFDRARNAAMRARYVSEMVTPVFGRDTKQMSKAAKSVQHVLSSYRDCALTQTFLMQVRNQEPSGDTETLLTRLSSHEAATAAGLRTDFAGVFAAANRKSLRRWMK